MDKTLQTRLTKWHEAIVRLRSVEETYLYLEASESTLEGKLFLQAEGKNNETRMAIVHTQQDWIDFQKGKVLAKAEYNEVRRELELKIKAYEAEYITLKVEAEAVRKHPS